MYELKLAQPKDIQALKNIWKICFNDTDRFIDFFFENIFPSIYPVALFHLDKPIGMMYLFPVSANENNRTKKGFYIYAIGIHPEYRGKNIFQNHMNKPLFEYLLNNDMFCVLCPANEKLSDFYKKLQYKSICSLYKTKIYPDNNKVISSYKALDSKELYQMRKDFFDGCITWDIRELELILKSIRFSGGDALNIEINNKPYYCITEKNDDEITILESNITPEHFRDLCNFLCNKYMINEVNIVCNESKNNLKYTETLSYNLKDTDYYFNFAMQ